MSEGIIEEEDMPERNFKTELLNLLRSFENVPLFMSIKKKSFSVSDIIHETESSSEIGEKIVKVFKHMVLKEKTRLNREELELLVDLVTGIMMFNPQEEDIEEVNSAKKMVTIRYSQGSK